MLVCFMYAYIYLTMVRINDVNYLLLLFVINSEIVTRPRYVPV